MPKVDRPVLKGYFERGDQPSQSQFSTLIDSMVNIVEDRFLLGLREYDPLKQYLAGDTAIFNNGLYECLATTTGAFDPSKWQVITTLGAVIYTGVWNALTNTPTLSDGTGAKGFYYVVSVAGSQDFGSGTINFDVSDWVIYNGLVWQKVDNSQAPVVAADVDFTPNGDITATNVQDAIVEVRDETDTKLSLKADKVVGATLNGIAILDASGNLVDSGMLTSDFLPSTTVASDIPFTPDGDITATNVQDAIVEVRDDADTKLSLKADKVVGATLNDIAILDASGNLVDSGMLTSDFLPATATASDIAFTPNGDITATNVQNAIVEVRDDTDTKLSHKADLLTSGVVGHLLKLEASGNYIDSGKAVTDFLPSTTTANNIPFTPNGDITSTIVQDAIVEVRDDTDTKLLAKLNRSGGTMTGNLILNADPSTALGAATKQYVDANVNANRILAIPFTFDATYLVSSTSVAFARIPLQVTIPAIADVFPGATTISAKLYVDYLTQNGAVNATGEAAVSEWTTAMNATSPTAVSGSVITLAATGNSWVKIISSSFTLNPSKSYQVILRKTAGTGSTQVQVEGATLVLTYS
jgi:hypothetical protein